MFLSHGFVWNLHGFEKVRGDCGFQIELRMECENGFSAVK